MWRQTSMVHCKDRKINPYEVYLARVRMWWWWAWVVLFNKKDGFYITKNDLEEPCCHAKEQSLFCSTLMSTCWPQSSGHRHDYVHDTSFWSVAAFSVLLLLLSMKKTRVTFFCCFHILAHALSPVDVEMGNVYKLTNYWWQVYFCWFLYLVIYNNVIYSVSGHIKKSRLHNTYDKKKQEKKCLSFLLSWKKLLL